MPGADPDASRHHEPAASGVTAGEINQSGPLERIGKTESRSFTTIVGRMGHVHPPVRSKLAPAR